jgi:cytochrome c553
MRTIPRLCAIVVLAGAALPAIAQEDVKARNWAVACNACHGTDGRSEGGMPAIAGRSGTDLHAMLIEFKEGKRPATVMQQLVKGYSGDELRRIAEYFSRQKPEVQNR